MMNNNNTSEDMLWDHYSGLPNPAWYQYKNKTMNKKLKFKTLELLNFEGPVLMAHKAKSIYVITDQWKEIVNVLTQYEMEGFLNGEFSIVDTRGKSWLYTNEHSNAKRPIEEVKDFIKM